MIRLDRLDHLVLTVADIETSCAFYADVLGLRVETFGKGRKALHLGEQKINLHAANRTFEPKAARPTPGSADLCFLTSTPLEAVIAHLRERGVPIETGPVARTGARGPIVSVYLRDPDANLIEIGRPGGGVIPPPSEGEPGADDGQGGGQQRAQHPVGHAGREMAADGDPG